MKKEEELISIVVPVYNVEQYLEKCIDSLINQTYKNLEIILVDDQSPDRCGEICETYAKQDARVRVVHQKNSGVGKAREKGMSIARGEYLVFVDSDDWLEQCFCEKLLLSLLENDAEWVACNAKEFSEDGREIYSLNNIETKMVIGDKRKLFEHYFEGKNYPRVVWGKLFKTSFVREQRFQKLKICEDTCFMIELFQKNSRVVLLNDYCYNYLRRRNSVTSKERFRVEDFDYIRGIEYIGEIVKSICPNNMQDLEDQKAEVLVNMYVALITRGTNTEIEQYRNDIRKQVLQYRGKAMQKHVFMIKHMNMLYDFLIRAKYKR